MELRHLRYFVAVAEELNFTRAAARLHMAQPPLSQQIRLLEREVGAQLLDRSTRHVALTVAGAAFLDEARRTLAQAERAIRRAKEASGQITSSLSVAFVESASSMYLPEVVRRFRCGHPLVRIELRQHTTSEIAASLARGEADVGLLRPTRAQPAVVLEEIGNDPLYVALPADHRLSHRRQIALADLREEAFVVVRRSAAPELHDYVVGLFDGLGFAPRVADEAGERTTLVSLVGAGIGVAILPPPPSSVTESRMVYRPILGAAPSIQMCVGWHPRTASSAALAFVEVARDARDAGALRWTPSTEPLGPGVTGGSAGTRTGRTRAAPGRSPARPGRRMSRR